MRLSVSNLRWYIILSVPLLTSFILFSGLDWWWAKFSDHYQCIQWISIPAAIIGILVPLYSVIFWCLQRKKREHKWFLARTASIAFFCAFIVSTLIKSLTNRIPREPFEDLGAVDFSRDFRFGFMNGDNLWDSIVEGFPSGHTMTAFAMTFAVLPLVFQKTLKRLLLMYAIYIGIGVSFTVHWLSDVVAGAIIGIVIGMAVKSKVICHNPNVVT